MYRYLLVIAILFSLVLGYLIHGFNQSVNELLAADYKQKQNQQDEIIHSYKINSEVTFYNTLKQPEILNIMLQAQNASPEKFAQLHQQLYLLLKDKYNNLKTISNIRQLHFHMPDGRSFLRMHRPKKFGDPLFEVRESVRITNQQKIVSQGFEEGRIFNGYRFVYPIDYQNQHLGSVEISLSLSALFNSLQTIHGGTYCFLLDSNIIGEKVFKNEKHNYIPSPFGKSFSLDKGLKNQNCTQNNPDIRYLANHTSVNSKLRNREGFSSIIGDFWSFNFDSKVAHFMPVSNFKNQKVAYIINMNENLHIQSLYNKFIYNIFIVFSIFLLMLGLVFYAVKRQQQLLAQKYLLEKTVKERTLKYEVLLDEQNYIKDVLETMFCVIDHLNRLGKVDKLLYESCENLTHNNHYHFAHIHTFNDELDVPVSSTAQKDGLKTDNLMAFYENLETRPSFTNLLKYGELFTMDNLMNKQEAQPIEHFLEQRNINHAAFIPLRNKRDKTYGYLSLFTTDSQTIEERMLLKKLGLTISQSIMSLQRRDKYEHGLQAKISDYKRMIFAISQTTEKRYPMTQGHDLRVSKLARVIAYRMGLEKQTILALGEAAMLHDISKLSLSDEILSKPGPLSQDQKAMVKNHFIQAANEMGKRPYLRQIAEIIRFCREHEDGSGYLGLEGSSIPLTAKILGLASAFDAMTHERPYKTKLTIEEAINEIRELKNQQFDAELVEAAIPILRDEYKNLLQ